MRVWFLKETKSLCTSCGTGCNIVVGSREDRVYRYVPRENDAVNGCWMCDAGRLNYTWIGRPDRLKDVVQRTGTTLATGSWAEAARVVGEALKSAVPSSVALIASARQTNEELYLLRQIARRLEAMTDSVPRQGEADRLLLSSDKNPNSQGARAIGVAADPMGSNLPKIVEAIRQKQVRTLIVFGEDLTRHGFSAESLASLELLVVCDLLPNRTTALAHWLLPGCAHVEKRGSFVNAKGRLQRFFKAVEPPGNARPEVEILSDWLARLGTPTDGANLERLFARMAQDVPAFAGVTWAALGDQGVNVPL
jgi:NADH-quinone oxidoreductase subunit G